MNSRSKFPWGLAVSLLFFAIWNWVDFGRPGCSDCYLQIGKPFAFFDEGGFLHDTKVIWSGLVGGILTLLFVGMLIGTIWTRLRMDIAKAKKL
ncbi:MAG TPA: hypothetical protein VKD70_01515 [Candidatus Acidoferrum sp.]|nr:hypothetical protein [Candidatus Acidoferrum sp.]